MPSSASATTEISTLSLHDALPISSVRPRTGRTSRGDRLDHRVPGVSAQRVCHGCHRQRGRRLRLRVTFPARADAKAPKTVGFQGLRSEEHTSELQSRRDLVCRLLLPPPPRSPLFPYTTLFRSHPCDLGRAGLPEEIASITAYLASRRNGYVTGATVNVDGGSDFV